MPSAQTELYIMEQYHDYKMAEDESIVGQAHEIQYIVIELLRLSYPTSLQLGPSLPNYLLHGGISPLLSRSCLLVLTKSLG